MKKVIGLCLVLLISSVSVFAQDGKRGAKKGGDPAQRCEKMIADLKLDENCLLYTSPSPRDCS